jgi:hypothetical protein
MNDPLPPDLAAVADLLQRAARDEAPPPHVRARVLALDGAAARLVRSGSALLRRLIAVAVPDRAATGFAPAFGVRGAAQAGQPWLFKAEEFEIDLRTQAHDEHWQVAGQLFGMPQAQRVVIEGAATQLSVELGPTREFNFRGLVPGSYRLTVLGSDCEVVIPRLDLGVADPTA